MLRVGAGETQKTPGLLRRVGGCRRAVANVAKFYLRELEVPEHWHACQTTELQKVPWFWKNETGQVLKKKSQLAKNFLK